MGKPGGGIERRSPQEIADYEQSVLALARMLGIPEKNYCSVRQGGKSNYDANQVEKRRRRAEIVAGNSPESEATNEDSTRAVMEVLNRKDLFPWLTAELEMDRLGKEDWENKTDAWVDLDPRLCSLGLLDQYRIQIKSGWHELSGLGNRHVHSLLGITSKEWRELNLILLFGQATIEAIAGSLCDQFINYMTMVGVRNAREVFKSFQTDKLLAIMEGYEAMGIGERDWDVLLSWIRGRPRMSEIGGQVTLY